MCASNLAATVWGRTAYEYDGQVSTNIWPYSECTVQDCQLQWLQAQGVGALSFSICTRFYATLMNKSHCDEEESFFSNTRAADANESDPCPAFLVPSVPNWARRLTGASLRATPESVGPRTFLQTETASSPISSMTIIGPELTNCTR